MQTLEEYIAKRKIEDGMNEFDTSQLLQIENIDMIIKEKQTYLILMGSITDLPINHLSKERKSN